MKIAVIPARGGSKRIPKKNTQTFNGKPIIEWVINLLKKSKLFDLIIVSTDDNDIATISTNLGADVPFIRPSDLADDFTGTTEVIAHATEWLIKNGFQLNAVCCVYATAPLIFLDDLNDGYHELISGDWDYVFSATSYTSSIYRAFKKNQEGGVEMLFPEKFNARSQDLPKIYHDAAQFYWGQPEAWLNHKPIFSKKSKPIMIPSWRVQDIDTIDDWKKAECVFNILNSERVD